tara:strand:+ start:537 stop:1397 length:861 start_codon:yes stop_codon:yes gene_type:complete
MAPFSNVQASGPRLPSQIGAIIDYENTQSDIRRNEQDQAKHEEATFKSDWMKHNRDAAIQAAQELDPNADDYDEQVAGMHPFSFEVAGVSNLLTAKANIRNRNIGQQQKQVAFRERQHDTYRDMFKGATGKMKMDVNQLLTEGRYDELAVLSEQNDQYLRDEEDRRRVLVEQSKEASSARISDRADKRYEEARAKYDKTDIAKQIAAAETKRMAVKKRNQDNKAYNSGKGKNKGHRPVDDEEQRYWEERLKRLKSRQGNSSTSTPSKPTASPKKTTKNNIFNPDID